MSKNVAIVYWSGTGNTEEMARAVAAGVESAGGTAFVAAVGDFSADGVDGYDALAFGCPAMGAEELESDEFEPVWDECREVIGERPVVLFGSYDWGTGEWMETWRADAEAAGVNVMSTVIANNAPRRRGARGLQRRRTRPRRLGAWRPKPIGRRPASETREAPGFLRESFAKRTLSWKPGASASRCGRAWPTSWPCPGWRRR